MHTNISEIIDDKEIRVFAKKGNISESVYQSIVIREFNRNKSIAQKHKLLFKYIVAFKVFLHNKFGI